MLWPIAFINIGIILYCNISKNKYTYLHSNVYVLNIEIGTNKITCNYNIVTTYK